MNIAEKTPKSFGSSLMIQIGKLRKLAQPYFLPVEETNSWQFLLLIFALVAIVVGSTLILLTGLISVLSTIAPEVQARFLPGVPEKMRCT